MFAVIVQKCFCTAGKLRIHRLIHSNIKRFFVENVVITSNIMVMLFGTFRGVPC